MLKLSFIGYSHVTIRLNYVDGFQLTDLWTINKDNALEYALNTIGGALTGLIGGLGINFLISSPLVGGINTAVAVLSGDIKSWKEAGECFVISTMISLLTLGGQRVTSQFKNPIISRGLPTKFNRILEKITYTFLKIGYLYGESADIAVSLTLIIYEVM